MNHSAVKLGDQFIGIKYILIPFTQERASDMDMKNIDNSYWQNLSVIMQFFVWVLLSKYINLM